jgi:cytochrome P450
MIEYHPFNERVIDDPFPVYKQLRDDAPLHYIEDYDCFFLSRFEDIWNALQAQEGVFTNMQGTTSIDLLVDRSPMGERRGEALSSLDVPQHRELRVAVTKHFFPGVARRLEPLARDIARSSLDAVYERGECDVIHDYAMRLSVRIACTIIGIPLEDADMLVSNVNLFFQRKEGERGQTQAGRDATNRLRDYLEKWLDECGSRGGASPLMDDLLGARVDGKPLPREDLLSTLQLMVVGGTETLPKVFSGAAHRLWQNPDQRAEVAADPALAKDAFWEALRYDMPTNMLGRKALRPYSVHRQTIEPGQKLMFLWHCANHDEREFPEPDRFDIHRGAERILSFGHATHRCLGANVAQMEGRVLLEELLARIPDYEVDEERGVRLRSEFFNGWGALPIRWTPH